MTRTTELAFPSPNFHVKPTGGRLATTHDLQWNRVSNLEPSSPKVEILPLGHRRHKHGGPSVESGFEPGATNLPLGHPLSMGYSKEWEPYDRMWPV
ncbi:hypothetical protein AVEN_179751-1 [Araneus ventricosus]|uniref:Uncharacterized protein n=1 Tax=Araneus ventricosus TaxID=182803 RepID=A0A4Y2GAZ9_ARAVE|nr:hypothetical protein AVEN_179751-1 [Araneus ventricosus]